jgi:hypothetical protein
MRRLRWKFRSTSFSKSVAVKLNAEPISIVPQRIYRVENFRFLAARSLRFDILFVAGPAHLSRKSHRQSSVLVPHQGGAFIARRFFAELP